MYANVYLKFVQPIREYGTFSLALIVQVHRNMAKWSITITKTKERLAGLSWPNFCFDTSATVQIGTWCEPYTFNNGYDIRRHEASHSLTWNNVIRNAYDSATSFLLYIPTYIYMLPVYARLWTIFIAYRKGGMLFPTTSTGIDKDPSLSRDSRACGTTKSTFVMTMSNTWIVHFSITTIERINVHSHKHKNWCKLLLKWRQSFNKSLIIN